MATFDILWSGREANRSALVGMSSADSRIRRALKKSSCEINRIHIFGYTVSFLLPAIEGFTGT